MEISYISDNALKIKGKQLTCLVNPQHAKGKLAADIVLSLEKMMLFDTSLVEGCKLSLQGPGEYEVNSIKVSGQQFDADVLYTMVLDGMQIGLAKSSIAVKAKEAMEEYEIVILQSDTKIESSTIAAISPKVLILYGEKAQENVKTLGKEVTSVSKFVTSKDKIPSEMEVVVLA